jgi:GTP-binding protein
LYTTNVSRFSQGRFLISAAAPAQFPADVGAEVAFVGRSNAGKSSAINAITQRHSLARTSKTPGRTRLLNFFELAPMQRIVDLPGYGYATGPEEERRSWQPLIEALGARESLRGLFMIVDSRRGLTEADEAVLGWATPLPVHILLSKADKLNRSESISLLRSTKAALADAATAQLFSVPAKTGIDEAQKLLASWLDSKSPGTAP